MLKAAACGLACAVAFSASVALADSSRARIVTRDAVAASTRVHSHPTNRYPDSAGRFFAAKTGAVTDYRVPAAFVIERSVVEPAALVSRELAEQPVWPHLIEVFLFGEGQRQTSTIYLDPYEDYEHQGELVLDDNHFINRAQRLARKLRTPGARVLSNPFIGPPVEQMMEVKPHMILEAPDAQPATPKPHVPQERIVRSD